MSVLLSSIPFLLILFVFELGARNFPNVYKYKWEYVNNHRNIETLVIGSSHAYYGINPEYFTKKAFNEANVSQDLHYDYIILKDGIDKLNNLKLVVITLSAFSFYSELNVGNESWRIYNYRYWRSTEDYSNSDAFDIKNYSVFIASPDKVSYAARIVNYYATNHFDLNWSPYGWGINYQSQSSEAELTKSGKSAALRHQKNNLFNATSIEHFNKIIDICKSKNVKLLFVTTPAYHTYQNNLKKEILNNFYNYTSKTINNNNDVKYINYLNDRRFDSSDFYDADHLNHKGSAKFSKIIDIEIENMQSKAK